MHAPAAASTPSAAPARGSTGGSPASWRPGSTRWSTSGPTAGPGRAGGCATPSPSPASCRCSGPGAYAIDLDGERWDTAAMLVAVGNGPSLRRRDAGLSPTPGWTTGCSTSWSSSRSPGPSSCGCSPRCTPAPTSRTRAVVVRRARWVRVAAEGIVAYADGERFGPLPLRCETVPGALQVIAPAPVRTRCRRLCRRGWVAWRGEYRGRPRGRRSTLPGRALRGRPFPGEVERSPFGAFRAEYPFALDDFQVRACQALQDGRGVLVAAPTGAGKTVVGEFAVHLALADRAQVLLHHPDQGAVATRSTPTWCARYGADAGRPAHRRQHRSTARRRSS